MTQFQYRGSGTNSVGAYQMSGIPWFTSSIIALSSTIEQFNFPYVTRAVTVHNGSHSNSHGLFVGVTENGLLGSNYFHLHEGETLRMEIRTKTLFLKTDKNNTEYSILAELSTVPSNSFPILTASAEFQGVG